MGTKSKKITCALWLVFAFGTISCVFVKQTPHANSIPTNSIPTTAIPATSSPNPIIIANTSAYTAEITISYKAIGGHFFAKAPQSDVNIIIGPRQQWTGGKQAPIKNIYGKLFNPQGSSYSTQTRTRYSKLQPISPDKNYEYMFEIKAQAPGQQEYKIKQVKALKKTAPAAAPKTAPGVAVQALTNPGLFGPARR
jgi:hypothetical protein